MTSDGGGRLDAVLQVGLRLARSAPSGRVLLARIADAIDAAWIPRPWGEEIVAELAAAQASASEPVKAKAIERALREAWGRRPTEELDDFDGEPVAVTPACQVHRGLLEGAPVAIKVLRPGIARSVRQDLALLDGLGGPLGAAFPGLDARAVLGEFRQRVLDELDLEQEATAQRRFHRALRGHPSLMVPAPIMRLAHHGVLVSKWVDGVSLARAPERDHAAAQLIHFVLGATAAGLAYADPHPDDVLILPDGRLAILDFGAWSEVDRDRFALAAAAFHAFFARDIVAFGDAVQRLGWLPAGHAAAAFDVIDLALADLAAPGATLLDRRAVLAARDRIIDQPSVMGELLRHGALAPQDLWPARGIAQLFATIARVGATGDWPALIAGALRDGWGATETSLPSGRSL